MLAAVGLGDVRRGIADRGEFKVCRMALDRLEMPRRDAAAADDAETDLPFGDQQAFL